MPFGNGFVVSGELFGIADDGFTVSIHFSDPFFAHLFWITMRVRLVLLEHRRVLLGDRLLICGHFFIFFSDGDVVGFGLGRCSVYQRGGKNQSCNQQQ